MSKRIWRPRRITRLQRFWFRLWTRDNARLRKTGQTRFAVTLHAFSQGAGFGPSED